MRKNAKRRFVDRDGTRGRREEAVEGRRYPVVQGSGAEVQGEVPSSSAKVAIPSNDASEWHEETDREKERQF